MNIKGFSPTRFFIVLSRIPIIALLCSVNLVVAATTDVMNRSAIEETLRKAPPNTQISSIQNTPINGLLEIIAGKNVLYSDPTGQYLVVGSLYDMHTATDLTAERKTRISKVPWESLPLEGAVKYGGSGPLKLAVFFDPDCLWCKKLHEQLTSLIDVEVYALMYPVETLHPKAKNRAANILCSSDPLKALDAVMTGKVFSDHSDQTCLDNALNTISKVESFARAHNIHGTPTLVVPDGRVHSGFMTAKQIEVWLNASN